MLDWGAEDWSCNNFVRKGEEWGWLNPYYEEWVELFDPDQDLVDKVFKPKRETCRIQLDRAMKKKFDD